MEIVILSHPTGDYAAGVNSFLSSLGWSYLRHRYGWLAQGLLLRLLTLSGLEPWGWERCAMQLVTTPARESTLLSLLRHPSSSLQATDLQAVVAEIWNFAATEEAPVGEPPITPAYLTGYGYTQADYLSDLAKVYGASIAVQYELPWPDDTPSALQKPLVQPLLLQQAAALMGATAGAIERLITLGGSHGDHRE